MKIAILDCPLGIAGDMTVGALLDLGMPFELLKSELKKIDLHDYQLSLKETISGAFRAKKFSVDLTQHCEHGIIRGVGLLPQAHRHDHTPLKKIERLISTSQLHPKIKATAKAIFRNLGKAESRVHGVAIEDIHFHEAGAVDSILDIVSVAICVHHLKIEKAFVRSLVVGRGIQKGAHGRMPIPVPGAYELLKGYFLTQSEHEQEMVTPTGAAILSTLCEKGGKIPKCKVLKIGYGAGDRRFEGEPGFVRVSLAQTR